MDKKSNDQSARFVGGALTDGLAWQLLLGTAIILRTTDTAPIGTKSMFNVNGCLFLYNDDNVWQFSFEKKNYKKEIFLALNLQD